MVGISLLKKRLIKTRKNPLVNALIKDYNLYIMILPVFIGFIVFKYLPIYGLQIAFKDYNIVEGYWGSPWVGLEHFMRFFKSYYFLRLVKNTFLLGIYSVLFGFWPPILLALLLNEVKNMNYKRVVQTISYLPHFIATVVIVGLMMELTKSEGVINGIIKSLGGQNILFFSDPSWFRPLYIISGIWQGIGWSSIIYLAALSGLDVNLYDAAYIDGANRFQRARYITIPGIAPTITILLILRLSHLLTVGFEKVFLMYNPSIYKTADVISTYVYRKGIIQMEYGFSTAVGLTNSVVSIILLITANKLAKTFGQQGLW